MTAGMAIAEALVATALVAFGAGIVAGGAAAATRAMRLARHDGAGVARALSRAEALRAGPRASDGDVALDPDGTPFSGTWTVRDGRGRSTEIDVRVDWPGHGYGLATAVLP